MTFAVTSFPVAVLGTGLQMAACDRLTFAATKAQVDAFATAHGPVEHSAADMECGRSVGTPSSWGGSRTRLSMARIVSENPRRCTRRPSRVGDTWISHLAGTGWPAIPPLEIAFGVLLRSQAVP